MSIKAYRDILRRATELSPNEQLRLIADIAAGLRDHLKPNPPRSILELQGLGKEIWNGIDAQEYVNKERDSWDE